VEKAIEKARKTAAYKGLQANIASGAINLGSGGGGKGKKGKGGGAPAGPKAIRHTYQAFTTCAMAALKAAERADLASMTTVGGRGGEGARGGGGGAIDHMAKGWGLQAAGLEAGGWAPGCPASMGKEGGKLRMDSGIAWHCRARHGVA
jgi:hypothetical protein